MKKNAGISTIMVTGLAAGISIFVMVILVVIKGAMGAPEGGSVQEQAAIDKAELIGQQFVEMVKEADLDVYWDRKNTAVVFVSQQQIKVMWKEGMDIKTVTIQYENPEDPWSVKKEKARDLTSSMTGYGGTTIAKQVKSFIVDDTSLEVGKLSLKIEYMDSNKQKHVLERDYEQKWSEGVEATKIRE
ncbi:MAG: hypothetical protein J5643_06555 [Lachnospiraceae bacterium]|nr:hypothetical protein [Lachnospiraceae bacterium]